MIRKNRTSLVIIDLLAILGAAGCKEETAPAESKPAKAELKAAKSVELDGKKVYPFMELKRLYQKNWKGEAAGSPVLDGKHVMISGSVFGTGRKSKLVDGEVKVLGTSVRFRGGEFKDPDFGHDVECLVGADKIESIKNLKKGDSVTLRGTISGQEITIEGSFSYKTLKLNGCEVVAQ